jgi:hypothetical protein
VTLRKGCAHVFVSVTFVLTCVKSKSQVLELQVRFALVHAAFVTLW